MMRRFAVLCLVLVTFPALAASCLYDLCGQWAAEDYGNFKIDSSQLVWKNHEFGPCFVVAQDPSLTITKCTKIHNVGAEEAHNVNVYFYLKRITANNIHVRYAGHLPDKCVAKATCWPGAGMNFKRVAATADTAPAPVTPAAPDAEN